MLYRGNNFCLDFCNCLSLMSTGQEVPLRPPKPEWREAGPDSSRRAASVAGRAKPHPGPAQARRPREGRLSHRPCLADSRELPRQVRRLVSPSSAIIRTPGIVTCN